MIYKTKKSFNGNLSFWGVDFLKKIAYFCSEIWKYASNKDAKGQIHLLLH